MKHLVTVAVLVLTFSAEAQEAPTPSTVIGAGQIGRAFDTVGTVTGEIQRKDFPIYTGTPTYLDQWVRTIERSQSGFRFFDNSRLDVGPNARVKIDRTKYDPARAYGSSLRASRGSFRFKSASGWAVRTPYATLRTTPGTIIEAVVQRKPNL